MYSVFGYETTNEWILCLTDSCYINLRYTECTKFLGRVCEVVSAREDSLDKLLLFHNGALDLREDLDQIQSELKTAVITSDQLMKWQEESQDLKAKLKECMK